MTEINFPIDSLKLISGGISMWHDVKAMYLNPYSEFSSEFNPSK